MTKEKKLKQTVRARAAKTGERSAEARRHVLSARKRKADPDPVTIARNTKGMVSEAKTIDKTGHGFEHWFAVLDRFDLKAKGHTAAAKHLGQDHGVGGWYAQAITIAYERAHGLRKANQQCTGGFQASVSRVLPSDPKTTAAALGQRAARAAWLSDDPLGDKLEEVFRDKRLRARADGSYRLRFKWDGASIEIRIDPHDTRSRIVADTTELPNERALTEHRDRWKRGLDRLKTYLAKTAGA